MIFHLHLIMHVPIIIAGENKLDQEEQAKEVQDKKASSNDKPDRIRQSHPFMLGTLVTMIRSG